MKKSLLLFISIMLGMFISQARSLGFLIQYFLMTMLFIAFLEIELNHRLLTKNIVMIGVANSIVACIWFSVTYPFNHTLALLAFVIAITPTATAAPSVISFLGGNVAYITTVVILTNVTIPLLLPFFIFILTKQQPSMATFFALLQTAIEILGPLILAQAIRRYIPIVKNSVKQLRNFSFILWVMNVFIAVARFSYFIHTHKEISRPYLMTIACITLAICISGNVLETIYLLWKQVKHWDKRTPCFLFGIRCLF